MGSYLLLRVMSSIRAISKIICRMGLGLLSTQMEVNSRGTFSVD